MIRFGVFAWKDSRWVFRRVISSAIVSEIVASSKRHFDRTGDWKTCVKLLSYEDL